MAIPQQERKQNLIALASAHDEYVRLLRAGVQTQHPALMRLLDRTISEAMVCTDVLTKCRIETDPAFLRTYRRTMGAINDFLEITSN